MTVIQLVKTCPIETVESNLRRMKELDLQIKELEAEKNMLKESVIANYFLTHDTYKTAKGLVLATYKSYIENRFNGKQFQEDHPDYYAMYKTENVVTKFLLK